MGTRYSFTTVHRVFLWGRESIVFCFLVTRPWKKYIVYCCLFSHFTLKRYCIAIIFWYFHFFTQNDFIIHLYCCMYKQFIPFCYWYPLFIRTVLDLQKNCKDSSESFHISHIQFPLLLMFLHSYRTLTLLDEPILIHHY